MAVIPGSVGDKPYFDPVTVPSSNETTGPLAGHVRKGRTYRSPLAATGVLTIGDWVRDDLPDLLWPVTRVPKEDPRAVTENAGFA